MLKKILLFVGGIAAMLLLLSIVLVDRDGQDESVSNTQSAQTHLLPWKNEITAEGTNHALGVNIGWDTVRDVATEWGKVPELGLFKEQDGLFSLEAFMGKVRINHLEARVVALLKPSDELLVAYSNGLESEPTPSGRRKYTLTEADQLKVLGLPIMMLVYVPIANYDEAQVLKRFGQPSDKRLVKDKAMFWLYPQRGLAILLDPDDKDVFYYTMPKAMQELEIVVARVIREAKEKD